MNPYKRITKNMKSIRTKKYKVGKFSHLLANKKKKKINFYQKNYSN